MASEWSRQEMEALRVTREFMTIASRDGEVSNVHVWLEGEAGAATLAVIFKHRDRPGCIFGSRHFHVEDLVAAAGPNAAPAVIWAGLEKCIDASNLPTDCRPGSGSVTWI